jgi:ATP-binding cassette subfamily C protein
MERTGKKKEFHISGGELFLTECPDKIYRVTEGVLFVYLIAFSNGMRKKRIFLTEMAEGEIIPAFCYSIESSEDLKFGFVALSSASFEEEESLIRDDVRLSFAEKIGIDVCEGFRFDIAVAELYSMNSVVEEGYIYKYRQESDFTKKKSLRLIERALRGRSEVEDNYVFTGKPVYDCASFLCAREKITIASYEKIKQSVGSGFTIKDIARLSHFNIREITLPGKWYMKDCGELIVTDKEQGKVYCAFPSSFGRYRIYDAENDRFMPVDSSMAKKLDSRAVMFYRPFPDEAITPFKMILFGAQKVSRTDVVRLFIMSVLGVLVGLLLPFFNEQVFDNFINLGNTSGIIQIGLVILACSLGNISFAIVKNLTAFRIMNSMEYSVQSAAIDRLFSLPESFFRQYDAADLGIRVMNISRIFNMVAVSISGSLMAGLFSLFYIVRMAGYSGKLTVTAIVIVVVSFAIVIFIGIRQVRYEKEKNLIDNRSAAEMYQYISGIEKIRSNVAEDSVLYNYLKSYVVSRKINFRKEKMALFAGTFTQSVGIISSMIFYYMVAKGDVSVSIGGFMGFITAFSMLLSAFLQIANGFIMTNQVIPMYEMARPILETLPENVDGSMLPGDITGEIELDNITFGYESEELPVIKGVSIRFAPGEYVGIVGASGSGKSTLLKLLMGFEKPQVGRIYYDGHDIDELDKRELRKKFGVVLQEGGLVTGNIYENITLSSTECSTDRVKEVIRQVGLEDDIAAMPMGLYTVINESGSTISGGQAQRILIARAIAGKPKVMFFDEATSALDNVTQSQVIETIKGIDATRIVIAHRLSTLSGCDRIIVLDQGKVAEEGSFEELMEKKGLFYELAKRQIA